MHARSVLVCQHGHDHKRATRAIGHGARQTDLGQPDRTLHARPRRPRHVGGARVGVLLQVFAQRAHPDRCSVCGDFDGPALARGIQRHCDLVAASRRVQDRARVDEL
eukprot:7372879-Prymnesium_polylepis.1